MALIGCGGLGRVHVQCIQKIAEAGFVAYADIAAAAAQACLKDFGGAYATTDVNRIFADDSIRAVYICTRHDSHAPLAIAAARAGKHILIEKPLALSIADCEAVAGAVQQAGVSLMPAFKMRYYPLIQKAHEFIDALCEDRPPAITAHDGLQATRLVLAADKAIRTGEVQNL